MSDLPADNFGAAPVAIVGAGTLGRRIALMMFAHGVRVRLYDAQPTSAQAALTFIEQQAPALAERTGHIAGKIEISTDLSQAVEGAWLIIEAIPEDIELKRALFGELDRLASSSAILASNSSSYPSSQMIDQVSAQGRSRVVNTHFYMPPTQNAVEIASCGHTEDAIITRLNHFFPRCGFYPFVVRKESVGFIFNRVWAAVKRECLEVVATGVSTPEDVDGIYKVSLGAQFGPFEMMDRIGLDVVYNIEKHYAALNPELSAQPLKLLKEYINQGHLGMKTGQGFYQYDDKGQRR
ncbi:3-hydroxybutyryl-CoA dehydrogenase [[Pantoea] beijingensis]|uniref:3-hydroxybutyryl-CoA dehydrogenase n=1 Tax=[Pantoea] beijingensis TaxID=1324864 RepID=A0A443IDN9_9GAMM|nr:3-hydroxyacyl-CoA dehydrogenase family protein [[Pantoea] beijingensis]RWR02234.1 3-hydroxybutyryl-CoA dehydrogenase [[Pantoea] beijingensis]